MEKKLKLAFSTCPNDTFMFHALVNKILPSDYDFKLYLSDIEDLNESAFAKKYDITKISFSALGNLLDDYVLLRSGSALGRGCGPLIVGRNLEDFNDLKNKKIAIPGINTTAALLLRLYSEDELNLVSMPFYEIMPFVRDKKADLGVVIHEGRFTYQNYNLVSLVDLGKWWEDTTGLPIPLGGIAAKRSLGEKTIKDIEKKLSKSILYGFENPDESKKYIRKYAQEMEDNVIKEHIFLYVNEFSVNTGPEGEKALKKLFDEANKKDIIKNSGKNLFL
ncbi:MAG: 1,4-dihydroxy-6-naphthoate synthase [Desulforegulaceae bacterium]|nr:1,4-dihydroxy-6-naphthoate synthase [Desulforegulaceae bacterium]